MHMTFLPRHGLKLLRNLSPYNFVQVVIFTFTSLEILCTIQGYFPTNLPADSYISRTDK